MGSKIFPIDKIRVGSNARTEFDELELRELARSISETGKPLQPPLGVELPDGSCELIAGERRLRASKIAGLTELEVVLREAVTAKDYNKWNLIENLHRVALKPVETARRVVEMLAMQDESGVPLWSTVSLAEELSKDQTWIVQCVNLMKAPERLHHLVEKGEVNMEVGAMIGALPSVCHEKAMTVIVERELGPMNRDDARECITTTFRRNLSKAVFTKDEERNHPEWRVCATCDYWGGNRYDVGGIHRAKICLNPSCYDTKQSIMAAAALAAREAANVEVTPLDQSRIDKIFNRHDGQLRAEAPYVDLESLPEPGMLVSKNVKVPKWSVVLKEHALPVSVIVDHDGRARELVDKALALQAARSGEYGGLFEGGKTPGISVVEMQAEAAAADALKELRSKKVCEFVRTLFDEIEGLQNPIPVCELVLKFVLQRNTQPEDRKLLCMMLGLTETTDSSLYEAVKEYSATGLLSAALMALLSRSIRFSGLESEELGEVAKLVGVNPLEANKELEQKFEKLSDVELKFQRESAVVIEGETWKEKKARINKYAIARSRARAALGL